MTRINLIPPEDLLDGKYIVGPRAYKEIKELASLGGKAPLPTGLGGYVDEATRAKLKTEYLGNWPELEAFTPKMGPWKFELGDLTPMKG